jgi:hypothetical protein
MNDDMKRALLEDVERCWMLPDKWDVFSGALVDVVDRDLAKYERCKLYVDYDPEGTLLEAVQTAGVECKGRFFSAEGIFRFRKIGWRIEPERIHVKMGYGTGWVEMWPEKSPELLE